MPKFNKSATRQCANKRPLAINYPPHHLHKEFDKWGSRLAKSATTASSYAPLKSPTTALRRVFKICAGLPPVCKSSRYVFIFVLLGKTSVHKPLLEYMSKKLNTR